MALLLGTIGLYVSRLGLAQGEAVPAAASDVLQDVVVEALSHADRFDPARQPMMWLLGIAVNVIKRKRTAHAVRARRELPIESKRSAPETLTDESEPFDLLAAAPSQDDPESIAESNEQVQLLLSLVSAEDQYILRLAVVEEVAREALATQLGTTPGAARVRLHRALDRLRTAWSTMQAAEQTHQRKEATTHE